MELGAAHDSHTPTHRETNTRRGSNPPCICKAISSWNACNFYILKSHLSSVTGPRAELLLRNWNEFQDCMLPYIILLPSPKDYWKKYIKGAKIEQIKYIHL